jgi:RNA polymerase-binding transcription factor DksA
MSEFASHEVEVDLAAFLPEGVEFETEPPAPVDDEAADEGPDAVEGEAAEDGPEDRSAPAIDLDALRQIELDLDAVDAAIAALDAGTYGLDPATGAPLDDALLAEDPTRLS